MDSPNSPDSPPSHYILAPVASTLPKQRGRPQGSKGRVISGSGSRVTKSSPIPASRPSPEQRTTRHSSRASSSALDRILQDQESPCRPQRKKARVGTSVLAKPAAEEYKDAGQPLEAPEDEPRVPLGRSHASAPEVPRTPRPTPTRHSQSEPALIDSPTAFELDGLIAAIIKKPLTEKQRLSQDVGNNYAFEVVTASSGGEKIAKVGVTKGPEKRRLSQIISECQHHTIKHHEDPNHVPIRLYEKAEKLALEELSGFRYKFNCNCKVKEHREYFTISTDVAREVVWRWREFCKQEPYDSKGKLRAFWEHRLNKMRRGGKPETIHDHEKRAKRWKQFMKPTDFEKIWYELTQGFHKSWPWRWQALALIECCVIVVLSFPSSKAVVLFFGIVLLIFAELLKFELTLTLQVIKENFDKVQRFACSSTFGFSEMNQQAVGSSTGDTVASPATTEGEGFLPSPGASDNCESASTGTDESDHVEDSKSSPIIPEAV